MNSKSSHTHTHTHHTHTHTHYTPHTTHTHTWPVRKDVQSARQSVEKPATLHWSQTTTATTTATTYNCTTTNVHPQPSIHVNGRCCGPLYNIDMQETQHLNHLSTAHRLGSPMKTFEDNTTPTSFKLPSRLCVTRRWTEVLSHNRQLP